MHVTSRIHAALVAAAVAIGCSALLAPTAVRAQQYPSKPVRLIVPIPPGGAPDVLARTIAERLGPLMGQTVVVENRPGANGSIAMEAVANAPADGYTLVIAHDSLMTINPHLYAKTTVNTLKDFTPIAMVAASSSFLLVVPMSLPVKTFQEFIEYAKAANPPLAYASGGSGSLHHLAMEMLKLRAGINLMHVPYKGGAPAVTATIAGEVSAAISSSVTASFVRAGRLRAIAVTGSSRLPSLPDVPTVAEFYPGFQMSSWFGLFAPAGLPEPILAKLRADIAQVLDTPDVRKRFQTAGEFVPYTLTPEEFSSRIHSDYDKFGKLVKQIGVRVD
jgi:tripartite-type tricarboxylate transporter receptor subunit TctC